MQHIHYSCMHYYESISISLMYFILITHGNCRAYFHIYYQLIFTGKLINSILAINFPAIFTSIFANIISLYVLEPNLLLPSQKYSNYFQANAITVHFTCLVRIHIHYTPIPHSLIEKILAYIGTNVTTNININWQLQYYNPTTLSTRWMFCMIIWKQDFNHYTLGDMSIVSYFYRMTLLGRNTLKENTGSGGRNNCAMLVMTIKCYFK